MRLFDLIFEVIRNNVPMKRDDFATLKQEMEEDTKDWATSDSNKLKALYAKYNDKWMVRTLLAVLYIPINKRISLYMNRIEDEEDEEF